MTTRTATLDAAKIDAIFAGLDQGRLPGAAVAIAIDGVPVYRRGFGLANMELPVLLGPGTRMRVGSITKHFAALVFLLLCEEGRAKVDDPIGRYLPNLHSISREVTCRQLMGHTSGLRDAMAVSLVINGAQAATTDAQLLALYETIDDVEFGPGTSWSYNNGGYVLLTAAIEAIAGASLDTLLRERIFVPLGMYDTLLRRWDTNFLPNSATLHFRLPDGRFTRDYMGTEISGAGGMVSTMDDLLRWLKHMDAPVIGSAESWRLMREPQRLTSGGSTGYGFGLVLDRYRGVETISHGGGVVAGNAQMIKVPSAGLDIAIAVNRADVMGADLANRIIDACIEGLTPRPDRHFDKRSGLYLSPRDGRVVELVEQGEMQLLAVDAGPPIPVTADDEGRLQLPEFLSFFQQWASVEDDGLTFSEFGDEDRLAPLMPAPEMAIDTHLGRYTAPAIGAHAEVVMVSDEPQLTIRGAHGAVNYQMMPLAAGRWKLAPKGPFSMMSGKVSFANGNAGMSLSFGRLRNLPFTRSG
jgi:D-aminopeptidase